MYSSEKKNVIKEITKFITLISFKDMHVIYKFENFAVWMKL